jgi:PAS domain S-box-containing protein
MNLLVNSHTSSARPDLLWACVTLCLSGSVVIGYAAIAFNWYFQIKVASPQARTALKRLLVISLACAACGMAFYATDIGWGYLRLCDLAIAVLAIYTWTFLLRMRGLSLVDERLAQLSELEQRARRYREIAELLPHPVWTATAEGHIDFSNQRWFQYAGNNHPWPDAVHPDDRGRLLQWWQAALKIREPACLEARLRAASGMYRTFVISATPIVQAGAAKWLGACADIEDQKLLAAERENQAKQKSFFLSALSHDLRTPLNAVALHAELLRTSVLDEEAIESATAITQNATAAGELIDRLLDFAKVGSMERNILNRISLSAILQKIHHRFLPLANKNSLFLHLAPLTEIQIDTDPYKLERIISNLVDNALKYTSEGGVTISATKDASVVTIQVRDTGIGVPIEKASSLFDEFYQVNNDERDRRKGFGLGLAICRSLARQLGGEVQLAATGPKGSRFEITLDLGASDARVPVQHDPLRAHHIDSVPAQTLRVSRTGT